MHKAVHFSRQYLPFIITFLCFFFAIVFSQLALFKLNQDSLSFGLTLDLLITIPLFYFLLIRKTEIPKTTVLPIFILGLVIGSYIIPDAEQQLLSQFKTYILPIVELGALTYVFFKVRSIYAGFSSAEKSDQDFYTILKTVSADIIPKKMVVPFATEIATIYYGFIKWGKESYAENQFTYHKRSGSISLFVILIMIIVVETIAVHILLIKWSVLAANILTLLSIYTVLQLFGHARALQRRPIAITGDTLQLRYGIMNEVDIKLSDIVDIRFSRKSIEADPEAIKLSQLGELEGHNTIITVNHEHTMHAMYGFKKTFKKIAFHVDDKERFKKCVEGSLLNNT